MPKRIGSVPKQGVKRFEPWDAPLHEDANGAPEEGRGLRYLVRFVNRAFTKLVEAELRQHIDMTYAQWSFIRILCDEDGLSQRELSERNGLMENTTLVALNLMEARGWVRRQRDKRDKRRLLVYLTESGRALGRLQPLVEKTGRVAVQNLTPETVTTVRHALRQVLANLEGALAEMANGGGARSRIAAAEARSPRRRAAPHHASRRRI
jgi:MarR family transcriptional regulator, organic hydroperoxide resistance regulator